MTENVSKAEKSKIRHSRHQRHVARTSGKGLNPETVSFPMNHPNFFCSAESEIDRVRVGLNLIYGCRNFQQ